MSRWRHQPEPHVTLINAINDGPQLCWVVLSTLSHCTQRSHHLNSQSLSASRSARQDRHLIQHHSLSFSYYAYIFKGASIRQSHIQVWSDSYLPLLRNETVTSVFDVAVLWILKDIFLQYSACAREHLQSTFDIVDNDNSSTAATNVSEIDIAFGKCHNAHRHD